MSVTSEVNTIILNWAIINSIDNINVISLKTASGELFRKGYQSMENTSGTERKYTFYLTESEGNGTLTGMSLFGNGATTTLGTGMEIVTQSVNITKNNTQSLLIYWNVRVMS
ncbi:hypothetical protein [Candidatus Formimonas warabiya]|uniref:Uncharacterized protein n=1 Tax=Formimonas warabiya TaxID=1761012 RepID=A0A3G1KZX9_FORW1|nr:hypothetical protein [Candidatus Formimonas warabiya]ATW27951.1 hypothetical protein DCMF_27205 [Candidatus Formimonas warabiya]